MLCRIGARQLFETCGNLATSERYKAADSVSPASSPTNSLLSESIKFTGLGSGTNFNSVIQQLVKI
jgi:hypothetical protein